MHRIQSHRFFPLGRLASAGIVALLAGACTLPADAQVRSPRHKNGDHPAIVVQRLHQQAGYDYASKFYPHPAWLYLYSEPPRDGDEYAEAPRERVAPEPLLRDDDLRPRAGR